MRNYFTYNNEYISGWRYWWRSCLQFFLVFFFGLGLYLQAVTVYKRAKSLGHSDGAALFFTLLMTILMVISFAIGLAFPEDSTGMGLLFSLPHWYLWFSNGTPPGQVKTFDI